MAIKKHLKRRVKKVFQVSSSKEAENGRKIGFKKCQISLKISFVSQSTQNLFAALKILDVNPASTAASLFVESNRAITSDTHSLFLHILCIPAIFCGNCWFSPTPHEL